MSPKSGIPVVKQGSKRTKATGAEKCGRASNDIICPLFGGRLYVIILEFAVTCNGDAMLKRFPFISSWNPAILIGEPFLWVK